MDELQLTLKERLILYNQYRIISLLDPAEADHCKYLMEVLESGYESEYKQLVDRFSSLSLEGCLLVHHILDMFIAFAEAKEDGRPPEEKDRSTFEFRGFSGNTETMYSLFADHLIKKPNQYRVLKGNQSRSPIPTLPRYRIMLSAWNALPNKHRLTTNDFTHLAKVIEASPAEEG